MDGDTRPVSSQNKESLLYIDMIQSQTCLNYAVTAHPSVPYSL
jgi:hypothetical protein